MVIRKKPLAEALPHVFAFIATLVCALVALFPHASIAANSVPVWTAFYNGTGISNDYVAANYVVAMAVDKSGNAFVMGNSLGIDGDYDYATVAYSGAGIPLWTNRFNGPGNTNDYVSAIAVDNSGSVYVTGYSARTNSLPHNYDYTTIKYSGAGIPLWTNFYHGPANTDDVAMSLVLGESGRVFVTGGSLGSAGNFTDYATVAYSETGLPLWTNRYNGLASGPDQANAMAVDGNGNVYVAGYSSRRNQYPYNHDYSTIKYSGAGVPLWTNYYNGIGDGDDDARAVAVDGSGNVFVTGSSYVSGPTSNITNEWVIIKYSSAGVPSWTNHYSVLGRRASSFSGIAVDKTGNVFVTGSLGIVAYSGSGLLLWTNLYQQTAIAVDDSGNVITTGAGTLGFSGAGVPLWTNDYYFGTFKALAVDANGNVFVAGDGSFTYGYEHYVMIKYATRPTLTQTTAEVGQFQFQFNADSNLSYVVEFRDALDSSDWLTLTNIPAQSAATNLTVTDAITNDARFYRVRAP